MLLKLFLLTLFSDLKLLVLIHINEKRKNFLVLLLKISAVCISLLIIYRQVILKDNFKDSLNAYQALLTERKTWTVLGLLVVMMFINWLLEALKWQVLMNKIQRISVGLSLRAIFSGITVSFFTPNRVGEFAGRILHLEAFGRLKAVIATIVGSVNQLLITIIAGVIALLFTLQDSWPDLRFLSAVISAISIVVLVAMMVLYFNVAYFYDFLHRIKIFRKIDEYTKVFSFYHTKELTKITWLSAARFIVFNLQYFFLIRLLGVDIDFFNAMRLIALIFLSMAIVPSFAIAELGIRGSIALYFMQPYSSNATGIVAASFALWFINLVIPAIVGAFTMLFVKLFKQENHE